SLSWQHGLASELASHHLVSQPLLPRDVGAHQKVAIDELFRNSRPFHLVHEQVTSSCFAFHKLISESFPVRRLSARLHKILPHAVAADRGNARLVGEEP